ncbi:replication protein [Streptomyces sp. SPB78]|nr:replication protein [Streptomyces sp. SPB78]EFL04307.1 replication protein [Streptomyces sp. SPB78]
MTEFSHPLPPATIPDGADVAAEATPARAVVQAVAPGLRRWQGRRVLNGESSIQACRGCGRTPIDPETGVIVGRSAEGYAVTLGVVRCGRIWFCPQCSAAIRRRRSEEVKTAALRWLASGGVLAAVVLTARHNRTHRLADLSDALWGAPMRDESGEPVRDRSGRPRRVPGAYQRMLTAPAFYGRPESKRTRADGSTYIRPATPGIRHRIGYAGMVRASEVTRSAEAGWHPHMNLLAFLGGTVEGTPAKGVVVAYGEPDAAALEEWEDWLRELWAETLRRVDPAVRPSTECGIPNCKCRGRGHGVMIKIIRSADDAALIDYLTKVQDGKADGPAESVQADLDAAGGAAMETVRADTKSAGRMGRRSMVPFQMLYRLWDLEQECMDEDQAPGYGRPDQLRAWIAEHEEAMAGRRAIEWTRGLRGHVGLEGDDSEETDRKFAYEEAVARPLTGGVLMSPTAYGTVVRGYAEPEVEAIVTAEIYDAVGDLVYGLGGLAGHVRPLTADEIAGVQEAMAARLLAQREERERQALIDRAEADALAADLAHGLRRRLAGRLAQLVAARAASGPTSH